MLKLLLIVLFFVIPVIVLYLCHRFPVVNKIGAVVICYAIGLIIGNANMIPESYFPVQDNLSTITIPLAIPLLLFSTDIISWLKLFRPTLLSMLIAILSIVLIVYIGNVFWGDKIKQAWKVSGMLIGVYTGGTPNLAAIKTAIDADSESYLIIHTYDLIISAIYLLFVISIAQKLLLRFLPAFNYHNFSQQNSTNTATFTEEIDSYNEILKKTNIFPLLSAFGLAVFIFLIGGGLSFIVPENYSTVSAIIAITTLGLLFSMINRVNKIKYSFQLGMYFILVFCLVVASMAKIDKIISSSPYLFYYVTFAVVGTAILHLIFARIFKIDTDTVLITSTALILSPPFVPIVAGSLKNKHIIISGLTVGIIGYAIGNYLGVFVAFSLK